MSKTISIETRFFHDACDLRDALLDAGFEPTEFAPTARDWKSGSSNLHGVNARPLNEVVHKDTPGPLNPTWVEWLMGFPAEWTACAISETPLSRRSRK